MGRNHSFADREAVSVPLVCTHSRNNTQLTGEQSKGEHETAAVLPAGSMCPGSKNDMCRVALSPLPLPHVSAAAAPCPLCARISVHGHLLACVPLPGFLYMDISQCALVHAQSTFVYMAVRQLMSCRAKLKSAV